MLVKKSHFDGDFGEMTLVMQTPDDLWHIYRIVKEGDLVRSKTRRKVVVNGGTRIENITLQIRVTKVDYQPGDGLVRISGQNQTMSEYIAQNQFHSFSFRVLNKLTLIKTHWTEAQRKEIEDATCPEKNAETACVVMVPGQAQVCLISTYFTKFVAKVTHSIPKKRNDNASKRTHATTMFYKQLGEAIVREVNGDVCKCLVLAGPGPMPGEFRDAFVATEAGAPYRSRCVLAACSSASRSAVEEVMKQPQVRGLVADTKALEGVEALDQLMSTLNTCPDKALYGLSNVERLARDGGVSTLLVTDALQHSDDLDVRQRVTELLELVTSARAKCIVLSLAHESGQRLAKLTGIAAIALWPCADYMADTNDGELLDEISSSDWGD